MKPRISNVIDFPKSSIDFPKSSTEMLGSPNVIPSAIICPEGQVQDSDPGSKHFGQCVRSEWQHNEHCPSKIAHYNKSHNKYVCVATKDLPPQLQVRYNGHEVPAQAFSLGDAGTVSVPPSGPSPFVENAIWLGSIGLGAYAGYKYSSSERDDDVKKAFWTAGGALGGIAAATVVSMFLAGVFKST